MGRIGALPPNTAARGQQEVPHGRPTRRAALAWAAGTLLVPTSATADAQATPRVVAALNELKAWVEARKGELGALIVDLARGQALAQSGAERPLNPASNMKLITAAAALDVLGPERTFHTGLYGQRRGDAVAVLALRGGGDPSLGEEDLWRLANVVAESRVREVGELLVDQNAFDAQFVPPAFEQQPDEWAAFRAPISALALERNTLTCNVQPTRAGQPAIVWIQPAGAIESAGSVATAPRGKGQAIQWSLSSGSQGLLSTVGGHISEGLGRMRFSRRLDDPRLVPGHVLAHQLRRAGLKVGPVKLGRAEALPRLTYHASAPLSQLLLPLGKRSDNFTAEMLLKALALEERVDGASSADGIAVLEKWLAPIAPKRPGERFMNGSGLFDANRVTATTLVRVLQHAHHSPVASEFRAQLSIGGVDGTLTSRFREHGAARRVRAKTGTLERAIALSGFATGKAGGASAFALLVTGIAGRHAAIRERIDRVVETLLAET